MLGQKILKEPQMVPTGEVDRVKGAVPYTFPFRGLPYVGPVDPLLGPNAPDDIAGLVSQVNPILGALERILIATRATHPNMSIIVKGPVTLPANSGDVFKFDIGGKRVPSLNTFIQNNSGAPIYIGIEDQPSILGIQMAAGSVLQIADVAIDFISIYVTVLTNINGVDNQGQPISSPVNPTVNVTILAWSNPEWDKVWGQTA
jgi:hypothetical protein